MYSIYLLLFYALLLVWKKTRRFAFYFLPWLIFGVSYDVMRLYPNYRVNPIDVGNLYDAEKMLFGIPIQNANELHQAAETCKGSAEAIYESGSLIPGEWFAIHHTGWADFLAGCFYLCWVPVPVGFAFYLYFKKENTWFLKFSWAFLFINILGFIGYYLHPASPPWYVMNYGFHPVLGTPGNVAGLGRWDQMTGIPLFHAIYGANANVFAAMPSLHATYLLITAYYAARSSRRWYTTGLFALICIGIWWTAVYTGHHYVLDVLVGILTAIFGLIILEAGIFRIPAIARQLNRYTLASTKD